MEERGNGDQAKTPEQWFESHSRSVKSAKISHSLLTPGGTIEQALAKSSLRDVEQLNGIIFLLAELELNGCTIDSPPPLNTVPRMALRQLIGFNAVGGKARLEAIESDIGIIDQAAHQTYITGKPTSLEHKTKKGFLRKDDRQEKSVNAD